MSKLRNVTQIVLGSCAVYLGMAACSAAERASTSISTGGSPSGGVAMVSGGSSEPAGGTIASGGTSAANGGAATGGLLIATGGLLDPVPDAGAQPVAPMVFDEPCTKTIAGSTTTYAEHQFPGKTLAQLASVAVLVQVPSLAVPGYEFIIGGARSVKDGSVAVMCAGTAKFVIAN